MTAVFIKIFQAEKYFVLNVGKVLGYTTPLVKPKIVVRRPSAETSDLCKTPRIPQGKHISHSVVWTRACRRGDRQGKDSLFLVASSRCISSFVVSIDHISVIPYELMLHPNPQRVICR